MLIQILTLPLHYFLCTIFVDKYDWGIKGTTLASNITMLLNLILITTYSSYDKDLEEAWFWPNKHSVEGLGSYFRMGVPATLMLAGEFLTF